MQSTCLALAALLFSPPNSVAPSSGETKRPSSAEGPDHAALQRAFAETLSKATLVGWFAADGKPEGSLEPERYEIDSVSKLQDDYWLFKARLKYGDVDLSLPLSLQVFWAGDTPVISLTDLTIPGLGKFTARVMIYGRRYVGTWQHGDAGGHMWGAIERTPQ